VAAAIVAAVLVGGRLAPHRAAAVTAAHDAGEEVGAPLGGLSLATFAEFRLNVLVPDPEGPLGLCLRDQWRMAALISSRSGRRQWRLIDPRYS
jgi:hypothetical protein